jgi:hypothetical protein
MCLSLNDEGTNHKILAGSWWNDSWWISNWW